VLYEPARDAWIRQTHPSIEKQVSIEEWVEQCTLFGPPNAGDDPDSEYSTVIAPGGVLAVFHAVPHERLIIVRRFS
jgi:hypothetical protein